MRIIIVFLCHKQLAQVDKELLFQIISKWKCKLPQKFGQKPPFGATALWTGGAIQAPLEKPPWGQTWGTQRETRRKS